MNQTPTGLRPLLLQEGEKVKSDNESRITDSEEIISREQTRTEGRGVACLRPTDGEKNFRHEQTRTTGAKALLLQESGGVTNSSSPSGSSPVTSGGKAVASHPSPVTSSVTSHQSPVTFLKPFDFLAYNHLQLHAACVLSDSGTISEESAMLNFPAISFRESMERPEAQDAGTIVLTGFDPDVVLSSIETVMTEHEDDKTYARIPEEYTIDNSSWRVLKLILGNTRLSPIGRGLSYLERRITDK